MSNEDSFYDDINRYWNYLVHSNKQMRKYLRKLNICTFINYQILPIRSTWLINKEKSILLRFIDSVDDRIRETESIYDIVNSMSCNYKDEILKELNELYSATLSDMAKYKSRLSELSSEYL